MYQYAYLVGDGILAIFWLLLFFSRKDLRKQQLFASLILTPIAPLADCLWFYNDYWRPEYLISFKIGQVPIGLESPLFIFLIGGIATVLYEAVFKKRHLLGKPRNLMTVIMIFLILITTTFLIKLGLNSIWASSLAMLTISIVMVIIDHDLIKDAIWSSLLMLGLSVILYLIWLTIYPEGIQRFWVASALSGIKIWRIPIEEIVWFGSAGIGLGILYEFWLNVNKYPKKYKAKS
jgi:hypothetical protein